MKGVLIILVVFGHTGINENIQKWIYSFHMPLFLIISGFFYKEELNIISIKRVKRLILPFVLFTFLAIIFPGVPLLILKNKPIEWSKIFYLEERVFFNTPIWFLIVLFFIEIKINIINSMTKMPKLFVLLLLLLLQILVIKFCPILPFGLRLVMALGATFYIGIIWKKFLLLIEDNKKIGNFIILILFPVSCFMSYKLRIVDLYKMKFSNNLFYYYILVIINLVLWIEIAKKLKNNLYIKKIGQNTLLILGTHYYILFFLRVGYKVLKFNEKLKENIGIFFIEAILTIFISYILIIIKEKYCIENFKFKKLKLIRGE